MAPITRFALFKWRPDTTDEQKKDALEKLLAMYKTQEHLTISGPRGGTYHGKEGINKGFDFAFTAQFKSAEARDEFNPSPQHLEFKQHITTLVMDALVYDFEEGSWGF